MIRPTKERENAHIQWVCRHRSLQLHSCPLHMKETGPATTHLLRLFLLYSYIQVSPNLSPAQCYSCLDQILGSCNPTWLHGFQTPLENLSASWKDFPLLLSCLPCKHTHNIHIHSKWNESKKFFSILVAFFLFFQTNLEGKLWKFSNANVPGARGLNVNNG